MRQLFRNLTLTGLLLSLVFFTQSSLLAQPQSGFSYQAVARDNTGTPLKSQDLTVRISIHAGSESGEVIWQEDHDVTTSSLGLFNLVIGGPDGYGHTGSSGSFDAIDWSAAQYYLKVMVKKDNAFDEMGSSPIQTVPVAQYANSAKSSSGNFSVQADKAGQDALFEVRRSDGSLAFAVYDTMVWVYTDETAKGVKGGFAVGGYTQSKGPGSQYMSVTPDSIRMYFNTDPTAKGVKGGFAVGGYSSSTKGPVEDYLMVDKGIAQMKNDSIRMLINADNVKGVKGGFAVGGYTNNKAVNGEYLYVSGNDAVDVVRNKPQVLWYPKKEALMAGNVNVGSPDSVGTNSTALGFRSVAMGNWSQAFGYKSMALGDYSTAIGLYAVSGFKAFAFGDSAFATGDKSFSIGSGSKATGELSFAIGVKSLASKKNAFAIGTEAKSSGDYAVAIGQLAESSNNVSIAMGYSSKATGVAATSIGYASNATNTFASAFGIASNASGYSAFALGSGSNAGGQYAVSIGYLATASGNYSTAMGYYANASAENSYAFGKYSKAKYEDAFALGDSAIASGLKSISLGSKSTSSGTNAVALGNNAVSSNSYSISIGNSTVSSGSRSTAIGYEAIAAGTRAVSIGAYYYKSFNFIPIIIIPPIIIGKGEEPPVDPMAPKPPESGSKGSFVTLPLFANRDNQALGEYSLAVGNGNLSENGGISFGVFNNASNIYSTAVGFGNQAVAPYSLAAGFANKTEGNFATAMGRYTSAASMNSFAIGTYNKSVGDPDTWVETDPLFQIGNGSGPSDTHDAFRVNKNGGTYIYPNGNFYGLYNSGYNSYYGTYSYNSINTDFAYTYAYGVRSAIYNSKAGVNYYSGYFSGSGSTGTYQGLYADYRTGDAIDVAEYIYDSRGTTEAGDVLVADSKTSESVIVSDAPYQSSVVGVVTTKPHLVMGQDIVMDENGHAIPGVKATRLALTGRVPCKVTDENGPIKPGDLLTTSSTPGHAMKWTPVDVSKAKDFDELKKMLAENERRSHAVIGKAVEALESGTGKIMVLVSLQ